MKSKTLYKKNDMTFTIEFDREVDGRWIAEIPKLPGVMAYGKTRQEALRALYAVALRTLADSVEQGSMISKVSSMFQYGVAHS
jgi:predicted RNase H-like HicB family nuclease